MKRNCQILKLFLVAFLIQFSTQQEGVDNCLCSVPAPLRQPCITGVDLSQAECEAIGCCYKESVRILSLPGSTPACFTRKTNCDNQCRIARYKRVPCGYWAGGRRKCDSFDCCYDRRIFPYCYFNNDVVGQIQLPRASTPPETQPPSIQTDEIIINRDTIENEPVGPKESFFNPETKYIIQVNCNSDSEREKCGRDEITKDECVALKCCWSYSENLPSCFHTSSYNNKTETLIDSLATKLEEYISVDVTEKNEFVVTSPRSNYDYGNFSVNVQCGINNENNRIQLCEAKTRIRCIDQGCCWSGEECSKPTASFNADFNPNEFDFGLIEDAYLADYWVPSLFEIVIDTFEDFQYTLSCTGLTSVQCGSTGITRSNCLSLGCCWEPRFLFEGTTQNFCISPLLTQTNNVTVQDEPLSWSDWSTWSDCVTTAPCSNIGERARTRECGTTSDKRGSCIGNFLLIEECNRPTKCVVTGWSDWNSWSQCSDQCGPGLQERKRECSLINSEDESCEIRFNLENLPSDSQTQECNSILCEQWASWSLFTLCNAPCRGSGTMTRQRDCQLPTEITLHDDICYVQEQTCDGDLTCPPRWTTWEPWSSCSESCTVGLQTRERRCRSDAGDIVDNFNCESNEGLSIEVNTCNGGFCLSWSEWENDGNCNASCEQTGLQRTTRKCLNFDFPYIEPNDCRVQYEECTGPSCRGNWATWREWAPCDNQCGPSITRRSRDCILFGESVSDLTRCEVGLDGLSNSDEQECNSFLCSSWGEWTLQDDCTALCRGIGTETRSRECLDNAEVRKQINLEVVDDILSIHPLECYTERVRCTGAPTCAPTWAAWSEWSSCSTECTVGTRSRSRTCTNDREEVVDNCIGIDTETSSCNSDTCLLWGEYSSPICNGPCDETKIVESTRECLLPAFNSANINRNCFRRLQSCEIIPCIAEWSQWALWTLCSDDCVNSIRERNRTCVLKEEIVESEMCSGPLNEMERCEDRSCDSWDDWVEGSCIGDCGQTTSRPRVRNCFKEANLINSSEIEEVLPNIPRSCYQQSRPCVVSCVPIWDEWSAWSECSRSCEVGSRRRNRQCSFNGLSTDPSRCSDIQDNVAVDNNNDGTYELEPCHSDMCLQWAEWVDGNCSAPCNTQGTVLRTRACLSLSEDQNAEDFGLCSSQTASCIGKCLASWSEWGSWSTCTGRCGPGTEFQTRFCARSGQVIPTSECSLNQVAGIEEFRRTRMCNVNLCDTWTPWANSECTKTCGGGGMFNRSRVCIGNGSVIPADNGASCTNTLERCGEQKCPDKYTEWGKWSACTQSCGEGNQRRRRMCITEEGEQVHINNCLQLGNPFQRQKCNPTGCAQWTTWAVGKCSVSCGGEGVRVRRRRCTRETEQIGINRVTFRCYRIVRSCSPGSCIGEWSDPSIISECSVSCGPGLRYRVKQCKDPATQQRIANGRCIGEPPRLSLGMPCRGSNCGG